ncbi:MAG: sigma-54-dependent transcriptional regulator, partial [Terriglobia bacterium]
MSSGDGHHDAAATRILVVEDDDRVRQKLAHLLSGWGYQVEMAEDGVAALEIIPAFNPSLIISDLKMPRMGGMTLLKKVRHLLPGTGFLMLTGCGTIAEAVESTQLGAFNFIQKPLSGESLRVEIKNWLQLSGKERRLEAAHRRLRDAGILGELVGQSEKMRSILALIERVAPSCASVLVLGESGTGKELAARTIHEFSPRSSKPFVAVNCAAIPETLIESELFGHEKGAFTGALQQRSGCFELAHEGTLLLDEIGEMPSGTQAKLLRVLEECKFRRIGGKTEISVDVRVIAATNKIPEEAISSGQLRRDLYYRLNVVSITMPPLRDRPEDIEDLAASLLDHLSCKHQRPGVKLSGGVLSAFHKYGWPGNVRELRNRLERALVTCAGDVITEADLFPERTPSVTAPLKPVSPGEARMTLD